MAIKELHWFVLVKILSSQQEWKENLVSTSAGWEKKLLKTVSNQLGSIK